MGKWGGVAALLALPLLFLIVFYFYPLATIVRVSMTVQGHVEALALIRRLASGGNLRVIGFTFGQALLSTLLTVAIALPGSYVFARYRFPGKSVIQALTTVPFVLPTVVVAVAFGASLGPGSWLGSRFDLRYTLVAILLAHVFYNYTVVLRMVQGFWETLDPQLEEAARTLGASPLRVFWEVTLPLLLPVVATAGMLVFIFCFTSFGVILILGGPRFATLEVEIYRQTIQFANLPLAAALSLIQIACTLAFTLIYTRRQERLVRPLDLKPRWATQRPPRTLVQRAFVVVNLVLLVILLGTPLLTLTTRSFGSGLQYYTTLLEAPRRSVFYVPPLTAVFNSLKIALMVTCLALMLGLLVSVALVRASAQVGGNGTGTRSRAWLVDALFMLPLGTSAVTMGLGYLLAMAGPPLALRGTVALMVFAHTLVALPFVVRSLLPGLQSIRPSLREAAATLGASPLVVFREVDLPIIWRALGVGAIFAFTISMGEFGATSLIARPEYPTIPIAIYRFLSRPGTLNYGQALAMSTILMIVCVVGFLAIEQFRPSGSRTF
jgi:thiamine transport system permease protein